jgi:acetylornithine deacetylase
MKGGEEPMTVRHELRERVFREIKEDEILGLFQRTIRTPSITTEEGQFGRLLYQELQDIGLDRVDLFDFAPSRPDVWGMLNGSGGKRLMFTGHTDTVSVAGWEERWRDTSKEDPFSAVVEDGEVWGRGSGDMKAGIVGSLSALKAIKRSGVKLRGDVLVAFVGDEESGIPGSGHSNGMKAIVRKISDGEIPRPDFAIYTEPTTLKIYPAQLGFIIADVTVTGRAAYFGLPWHGLDALKGAHKLLSRLFEYSDEIWARAHHPLLGRAFNLVTAIQGGGYIAVPEECKLSMIRKILPSETVADAQADLEGVVQLLAMNEGVQVAIEYTAARDVAYGGRPAEVSADLEPVQCLERAIKEITGQGDLIEGAPYWSEISFFIHELGIPAVYCGAGDILNCHTFDERVELSQLIDSAKAFALMMIDYCGAD